MNVTPCGTMNSAIAAVEVGALDRTVVQVGDAHIGPIDVTGIGVDDDAIGKWQSVTMTFRSEPSGPIEWMRPPLRSSTNSRPAARFRPDLVFAFDSPPKLRSCSVLSPRGFDAEPFTGHLSVSVRQDELRGRCRFRDPAEIGRRFSRNAVKASLASCERTCALNSVFSLHCRLDLAP